MITRGSADGTNDCYGAFVFLGQYPDDVKPRRCDNNGIESNNGGHARARVCALTRGTLTFERRLGLSRARLRFPFPGETARGDEAHA